MILMRMLRIYGIRVGLLEKLKVGTALLAGRDLSDEEDFADDALCVVAGASGKGRGCCLGR